MPKKKRNINLFFEDILEAINSIRVSQFPGICVGTKKEAKEHFDKQMK